MRWSVVAIASVFVLLQAGCVGQAPADRPFSREWASQIRKDRDFEARKSRIENAGPKIMHVGQQKSGTAGEKNSDGKPSLRLGNPEGISAGVSMHHGTSANVLFNHSWDFGRPQKD